MSHLASNNPHVSSTLLYLDGVSVAFDGFKAINSLSMTINAGEMRAIIGPNGLPESGLRSHRACGYERWEGH